VKNDTNQLACNIPAILGQKYENEEVIVVDDYSDEENSALLFQLIGQYEHLILTRAIKNIPGKKAALTQGISISKGSWVLVTDADCRPTSDYWIQEMMKHSYADVVLGYGPYKKNPGLLNAFIRFETIWTAIQYMSFAVFGKPYMGVGRNMAFRKSLFQKSGAYSSHEHIHSGDDDLFINQLSSDTNFAVCISPESFVWSEAEQKLKSYFRQKRRHVGTSLYYKLEDKILLALYPMSILLFYIFIVLYAILSSCWIAFLIYLIRSIVLSLFFKKTASKLAGEKLFILFPVFEILLLFYYIITFPFIFFRNNKW
jgi:cellulose synthase/poly-beta-1,6-N-acetylglucosamine synthase-like glycosyltransferase